MGKKVRKTETEAKKVTTEVTEVTTEVKVHERAKHQVKALEFLRKLNLEWVLHRPLEPGDLDMLQAQVKASEDGSEWANWWLPYKRVDGTPAPGINWGVSAPVKGGFLTLRLFDSGEAKAVLRCYPSGKGILTGVEPVVQALLARGDLPPWTDEDLASLL